MQIFNSSGIDSAAYVYAINSETKTLPKTEKIRESNSKLRIPRRFKILVACNLIKTFPWRLASY